MISNQNQTKTLIKSIEKVDINKLKLTENLMLTQLYKKPTNNLSVYLPKIKNINNYLRLSEKVKTILISCWHFKVARKYCKNFYGI